MANTCWDAGRVEIPTELTGSEVSGFAIDDGEDIRR